MSKRVYSPNAPQQQQQQGGGGATNGGGGGGGLFQLTLETIKKGDIVVDTREHGFSESEVNSNTQIHQKTLTSLKADGIFRIACKQPMMFSSILLSRFQKKNEKTGEIENSLTMKTFMDIYGDYAILDADGNHTTSAMGDSYIKAFRTIEESIAESIDANPAHKKKLLGLLKLGNKQKAALETPMIEMIESFIKRSTIEDKMSEYFGEEDMSKSPVGAFQLWIGVPKVPSVNDFKIPGTNMVIWTKVYDHTGERMSAKPISNWEHLMRFIYEKGDAVTKGRRQFRFAATAVYLAPSLYINSDKKVGKTQYKLAELHIYQIDYPKPRNLMSDEDMAIQRALKIRALTGFVINSEPEINDATEEEAQQQQQHEYHQSHVNDADEHAQYQQEQPDESVPQSSEQHDYDAMIEADQELQRSTKKGRRGAY